MKSSVHFRCCDMTESRKDQEQLLVGALLEYKISKHAHVHAQVIRRHPCIYKVMQRVDTCDANSSEIANTMIHTDNPT